MIQFEQVAEADSESEKARPDWAVGTFLQTVSVLSETRMTRRVTRAKPEFAIKKDAW